MQSVALQTSTPTQHARGPVEMLIVIFKDISGARCMIKFLGPHCVHLTVYT